MPSTPTRFFGGVSTAPSTRDPLANFGLPDPTRWHVYHNDFNEYVAGHWTVTTANGGAAALANGAGGIIEVLNGAADDNPTFLQLAKEGFAFAAGKQMFFKSRFKTSDATQSDVVMGLQITDTTPLAVSNGVYFIKNDDAATLDFVVCAASTLTTKAAIATLVDDTYVEVAFYYDGKTTVYYYINGVLAGSAPTTNLPASNQTLAVSFGIQNGAAAAKKLTVDYILVARER